MSINNYGSEVARLMTYSQTANGTVIPAISMATAGFVQPPLENEDENYVWCPFCDVKLTFQTAGHNPLLWHRIYSSNCPFIKNNKHVNVRDLGIASHETTVSPADFPTVISQSNAQSGDRMDQDSSYETEYMSAEMDQGEGHITISHDVQSGTDDTNQAETSNAEELNKAYRRQSQLRYVHL